MKYEMIVFHCPEDPTEKHILKLEFATERDRELTALSYIIYESNLKEILFTDPVTNESRVYYKNHNKSSYESAKDRAKKIKIPDCCDIKPNLEPTISLVQLKELVDGVGKLIDDVVDDCFEILQLTERIQNDEEERQDR